MERHYDDGTEPDVLPHYCAGPCQQGRKECPTPWACQQPEDDDPMRAYADWLGDIAIACGVLFVLYVIILIAIGAYL